MKQYRLCFVVSAMDAVNIGPDKVFWDIVVLYPYE